MEIDDNFFFDEGALLDRLSQGLRKSEKQVVFVVGAPLTAPVGGRAGVGNVAAVIKLIRDEFAGEERNLVQFDALVHSAENPYQAAFRFLQGRRGQGVANQIIRKAVLAAYRDGNADVTALSRLTDRDLQQLESQRENWALSPAVAALGELCALPSSPFGKLVLTSNFDPLIEISIEAAGGKSWRTSLHADGDFSISEATGTQVVHFHGSWLGTDTLHTGNQLKQPRPSLKNALLKYLSDKLVVIIAYGGWDDIFTGALKSLVSDSAAFPEILWSFYDGTPTLSPDLRAAFAPGEARNRVTLYSGVDCHTFLPELLEKWKGFDDQIAVEASPLVEISSYERPRPKIRKSASDRPPSADAWVGRDTELRALEMTQAKVVIISGIGGQGKSTLAAQFLKLVEEGETGYSFWDWRDCREENDRIRTQILATMERIATEDLITQIAGSATDSDLIETFMDLAQDLPCVFVFDNVDHYVDLERNLFAGFLGKLVDKFATSGSRSKIIITCRPSVSYDNPSIMSLELRGLELADTVELFAARAQGKEVPHSDIVAAHEMTKGHAFWIDMMAVQVGRTPDRTLKSMLEDIRRGRGGTPGLLTSIWKTLPERERHVLRSMAELRRPENEGLIADIVSGKLNFKNFKKALKSLVNLNLIVVKPERNAPDLYDLHPLVNQFVRTTFERPERQGFIRLVLNQYIIIIKGFQSALGVHLPLSLLERWSQKAELEIDAGLIEAALGTLYEIDDALIGGGHSEEYVRVARKLFEVADWKTLPAYKNFDSVCSTLIKCFDHLEEFADADDLLSRYEQTVDVKTARYIKFCDMKSHSYWIRGQFEEAIEWGTKGNDLKKSSHVDTLYDCAHNLALAQRDSGQPELALDYFLQSQDLKDLISSKGDKNANATLLGNVGRCLQFMGKNEDALICLRKSARLLEGDDSVDRLSNQSYAREWIGDTFKSLGNGDAAYAMYSDAEELLNKVSPYRARKIREKKMQLSVSNRVEDLGSLQLKRLVMGWVNGKEEF